MFPENFKIKLNPKHRIERDPELCILGFKTDRTNRSTHILERLYFMKQFQGTKSVFFLLLRHANFQPNLGGTHYVLTSTFLLIAS